MGSTIPIIVTTAKGQELAAISAAASIAGATGAATAGAFGAQIARPALQALFKLIGKRVAAGLAAVGLGGMTLGPLAPVVGFLTGPIGTGAVVALSAGSVAYVAVKLLFRTPEQLQAAGILKTDQEFATLAAVVDDENHELTTFVYFGSFDEQGNFSGKGKTFPVVSTEDVAATAIVALVTAVDQTLKTPEGAAVLAAVHEGVGALVKGQDPISVAVSTGVKGLVLAEATRVINLLQEAVDLNFFEDLSDSLAEEVPEVLLEYSDHVPLSESEADTIVDGTAKVAVAEGLEPVLAEDLFEGQDSSMRMALDHTWSLVAEVVGEKTKERLHSLFKGIAVKAVSEEENGSATLGSDLSKAPLKKTKEESSEKE